jgi:Tfp pilus assembly protein PilF
VKKLSDRKTQVLKPGAICQEGLQEERPGPLRSVVDDDLFDDLRSEVSQRGAIRTAEHPVAHHVARRALPSSVRFAQPHTLFTQCSCEIASQSSASKYSATAREAGDVRLKQRTEEGVVTQERRESIRASTGSDGNPFSRVGWNRTIYNLQETLWPDLRKVVVWPHHLGALGQNRQRDLRPGVTQCESQPRFRARNGGLVDMRETDLRSDIPSSVVRLERRARRRLCLVSWLPVFAAAVLGTVVTLQVKAERNRLVELNDQMKRTETRMHAAEQARAAAESRRDELNRELTSLQSKVNELEAREVRLRQAVDSADPQVAIAKIRKELGGRTAGERADSLWRGGQDALNKGQLNLAEKLFQEAVDEDPTFAPAINGLGRVAADRGDRLTAEKFYLRAVAADPKYRHGVYNLAHLYFLMKKYDKALSYVKRTLELDPSYPGARELLTKLQSRTP